MKRYKCICRPSSAQGFSEASREELSVLITVMEATEPVDEGDIPSLAGVSAARAKSALAFWEAEGVISECECDGIIDEFAERDRPDEIREVESRIVAKNIRDENLKGLLEEIAAMLERPTLTDPEIKDIVGLVTQLALTEDYILELAAHIRAKGALTVNKLRYKAIELVKKGIDNSEALGVYLNECEKRHPCEMEFRKLLGIYERKLSDAERTMFIKWADEFGYSTAIVGEAYSIATLGTGKLSLAYMDKVLTAWHEAGCKTVEECRAAHALKSSEEKPKPAPQRKSRSEAPKPRYGDFDINDAFSKALERSYSTDKK